MNEKSVSVGFAVPVVLTFLFQIGGFFLLLQIPPSRGGGPAPALVLALAQIALMLLPTLYLARRYQIPSLSFLRIRRAHWETYILALVGTVAIWQIAQSWLLVQELWLLPSSLFESYRDLERLTEAFFINLYGSSTPLGLALALLAAAVTPAIAEETLFRGFALTSFQRGLTPRRAIILSSLIFALVHLQPFNFIPLFAIGLLFGFITYRSESILPGIVGHAIFNAISIVALYQPSGKYEPPANAIHTSADFLATGTPTILALILLAGVIWRLRSKEYA